MKYYKSHRTFIEKNFGKTSADRANYGWCVTEDNYISKVYSNPVKYVVSYKDEDTNRLKHYIIG